MSFLKSVAVTLALIPMAACGEVVITKPQYATSSQVAQNTQYQNEYPLLYLECGDVRAAHQAVSMVTLAQLNDPDKLVRFNRVLPKKMCRATNVTLGGYAKRIYLGQTSDGWTVEIIDWVQSNGYAITFVNPADAYIGRTRRSYQYVPPVPRRRDDWQRPKRQNHDSRRKMDVDEGQDYLRRQLELLKKR